MMKSDDYHIGVYGLGVMGSNIALNFASKKALSSSSPSSSSSSSSLSGAKSCSRDVIYASNWEGDPTLVDKFEEEAKKRGLGWQRSSLQGFEVIF